MVKVGIIGSGFGLYGLLPAFHTTPGCKVVAICGKHSPRFIDDCKSIGLTKTYTDWKKMLDKEKLDAVAIAVTPKGQYQIAKTAIKKNLHIFAEKPLAANYQQAKELLDLAKERKIVHAIDFTFPEIEEWKKVKKIIDKKRLGRLKKINLNWDFLSYDIRNKISSWKTNIYEGGGALSFYFAHSLYYLEYFAGKIIALKSQLKYSKKSLNGGETGVDLLLQFSDNITGQAHLNCNNHKLNRHQLIFTFEEGQITLENKNSIMASFNITIYKDGKSKQLILLKENYMKENYDERVKIIKAITTRFIDSITNKREFTPNFNAGIRVQELIEQIRKQSQHL